MPEYRTSSPSYPCSRCGGCEFHYEVFQDDEYVKTCVGCGNSYDEGGMGFPDVVGDELDTMRVLRPWPDIGGTSTE